MEEISLLELCAIAKKIAKREEDPIVALALRLGIKRLHEASRKRLEAAWEMRLKF